MLKVLQKVTSLSAHMSMLLHKKCSKLILRRADNKTRAT